MSHPSLGLPPDDPTAGLPDAAARLRADRARLADRALEAAIRRDPSLRERHPEVALRRLRRDYDRHFEQLAQALETGLTHVVTTYAEWLMPIYRRRGVPALDLVTLVEGMRDACQAVLAPAEIDAVDGYVAAWIKRLRAHAALPGDHRGNAVVRFLWKGTGILDESAV